MNLSQSSRPSKVGQAVALLYACLGIGILRSVMETSRISQGASVGLGPLMQFVVFGLGMLIQFVVLGVLWFFIYMIGAGRNWSRITFLVLFVIGIPLGALPLLQSLAANLVSGLLGVAQTVIQVLALTFLFQKPSSEWFREMEAGWIRRLSSTD